MWVAAVSSIPFFDFAQVLPLSSLRHTPPLQAETAVCRHIFGRGRSCVPLFTLQARPFTFGSKTIQYVVLVQSSGTPIVALVQEVPPSSLRKAPISVYVIKMRLGSNGSKCTP